jgi:manganese/zinc/iron transport system permease protein
VRAHRLWEIFLITQAGIAPDRVDRDADEIEHVLPPETLADLEARLAEAGRVPLGPPTPPSPHSSAGAMVN